MSQASQGAASNADDGEEEQGQFSMPLTVDRLQVRRFYVPEYLLVFPEANVAFIYALIRIPGLWHLRSGHEEVDRRRSTHSRGRCISA